MSEQPKQPVPAMVLYHNTGKLPPVEYNWAHILQVAVHALQNDKPYVILPVEEAQDFKPQRRRLLKEDKASPRGLIQRDDFARQKYFPHAAARFDAKELQRYAADKFNEATLEAVEKMADEAITTIE